MAAAYELRRSLAAAAYTPPCADPDGSTIELNAVEGAFFGGQPMAESPIA